MQLVKPTTATLEAAACKLDVLPADSAPVSLPAMSKEDRWAKDAEYIKRFRPQWHVQPAIAPRARRHLQHVAKKALAEVEHRNRESLERIAKAALAELEDRERQSLERIAKAALVELEDRERQSLERTAQEILALNNNTIATVPQNQDQFAVLKPGNFIGGLPIGSQLNIDRSKSALFGDSLFGAQAHSLLPVGTHFDGYADYYSYQPPADAGDVKPPFGLLSPLDGGVDRSSYSYEAPSDAEDVKPPLGLLF